MHRGVSTDETDQRIRQLAGFVARRLPATVRIDVFEDLVSEGWLSLLRTPEATSTTRIVGAMFDYMRSQRRQVMGITRSGRQAFIASMEECPNALDVSSQSDSPFDVAVRRERWRLLARHATGRERVIVRGRARGLTAKQIGSQLGIGEARVSQLEARFERKVRTALNEAAA